MKKWVQIVLPVMLFATVLYFCVFAVVFYQSEQTAALAGPVPRVRGLELDH